MIACMITCLSVSHRMHTDTSLIKDVKGGFHVFYEPCSALLLSELDLELSHEQVAAFTRVFRANYNDKPCPSARIFSFAHILYHQVTDNEG